MESVNNFGLNKLLVLELNLIRKAWTPYAKLELRGPGLKKIIAFGTRSGDAKQDR